MDMPVRKVLIIRFSSIGDIVLTTPVIRSLRKSVPDCEIHFLTRAPYADLLRFHPDLDHLHLLEDSFSTTLSELKRHSFDHILDLHSNLRSRRFSLALGVRSSRVNKKNIAKYLMVRKSSYPGKFLPHIVQRYGETLGSIGAQLDDEGLDIHYPSELDTWATEEMGIQSKDRLAVVLGAKFRTKRWIPERFIDTINRLQHPVVLIGGPDAQEERDLIYPRLTVPAFDAVNKYSLLESTALLNQCQQVLSHDTGFMHIAAALGKRVYSIWGSTVPALGMTPYKTPSIIIENQNAGCRPCSKIGFQKCPKGHFDCMRGIDADQVVTALEKGI